MVTYDGGGSEGAPADRGFAGRCAGRARTGRCAGRAGERQAGQLERRHVGRGGGGSRRGSPGGGGVGGPAASCRGSPGESPLEVPPSWLQGAVVWRVRVAFHGVLGPERALPQGGSAGPSRRAFRGGDGGPEEPHAVEARFAFQLPGNDRDYVRMSVKLVRGRNSEAEILVLGAKISQGIIQFHFSESDGNSFGFQTFRHVSPYLA